MKIRKPFFHLLVVVAVGTLAGCATMTTKSTDVSNSVRASLDQAGLRDVSVSQDRERGIVTLGGHVAADSEKLTAESLAKSIAGAQVVSNQIAVIPPGNESAAKQVNSNLDDGIESNLNAALIQNKLQDTVKYTVKNHVVTLTGEVESQARRKQAAEIAAAVPNVKQVVNTLQVKNQKASSSL